MQINAIRKANAKSEFADVPYFCQVTKGELIKQWREYKGMSQEELAVRAGMDVSSISQIERGKRMARIDTMKKIAFGLGLQVTDLSHRPPNDLTRESQIYDLRKWLDDPNATFEGRPVSQSDKELIERMFRRLYEKENPDRM